MAYVAELDQNEEVEDFCSRLGAALEFSSMRVEPERIELFRRAPCVVGSPFRSANRAGQPITTPKERADYDDPPPEQATQPSGPPPEPSEPLDAQGLKRVLREPPRGRYQLIGWDLEGAVVGKEEDAPSPPGARLGLELPLWRRLAAAGVSLLELMFCGLFLPFLGLVLGPKAKNPKHRAAMSAPSIFLLGTETDVLGLRDYGFGLLALAQKIKSHNPADQKTMFWVRVIMVWGFWFGV